MSRFETSAGFPRSRAEGPCAMPWTDVADSLLAVLFAPECAACGTLLASPTRGSVCAACWSAVVRVRAPFCETCGDPLPSWRVLSAEHGVCPRCRRHPRIVDRSRAAGEYD